MSDVGLRTFGNLPREPSLSDKVSQVLTEAIVLGKLRPGDRLPAERELGDQFGVSRTVIREAVRSLTARGLVRVTSGRGAEISQVDSGTVSASMRLWVLGRGDLDYGKVHEARTALEVQTCGLAALRATREEISRLQQLCDDQQSALDTGDLAAAVEHDYQFHRELCKASGNELLLAMFDSISDVLREVRHRAMVDPGVAAAGIEAHRRILKCAASGKPVAARRAMEGHLTEAAQTWRGIPAAKFKSIKGPRLGRKGHYR